MAVPPGVSEADFAETLRRFAEVVGSDWVFTSEEDVALYRDAYSPFWDEPEERLASAAVAPASVEEVQAVVRAANDLGVPLYTISTGKNLGYGGSAPVYSGSVVLDLKRMNRVIEINEPLAYAVVEPGVSFFDLYDALRERGVRLLPSVPAPGWGSPVGNSLDRGLGTPAGDHFANHCGMEVVLANGELLRTGMGALDGARTWQTFRYGFGPEIDGLFCQSNFGVVTKMGFNLFPEPESARSLSVLSNDFDDLDALVATAFRLHHSGVVPWGSGVFSPALSADDGQPPDPAAVTLLTASTSPSAAAVNTLASGSGRPVFAVGFSYRGAAKVVDAQIEATKDTFAAAVPNVQFADGPAFRFPMDHDAIPEPAKNTFGIPTMWRFFPDLGARDWGGHYWFSPIIEQTGDAVRTANRVFQEAAAEMGFYWGWQGVLGLGFPKNYTILYSFQVERDRELNRINRERFVRLLQVAADNGWSEYRTAPAFQDALMDIFAYNDHALRRFQETLKDAVDPKGILSAGKSGVWPRHLRSGRP